MHWLRHKQPAQDLVQFGLMTAAVAIVALAGLEFLSGSIRWYFGDVAPTIAPPAASVPGFPLHTLQQPLVPTCGPTTLRVGDTITCRVTFADADPLNPQQPTGKVDLLVSPGGTSITVCSSLTIVAAGISACPFSYTVAQPGSLDLTIKFTPTSNHIGADTSTSPIHLTVIPDLRLDCGAGSVEIAHPIDCLATLTQSGPGSSAVSGKLNWTLTTPASGPWTFVCSADPAVTAACSAGAPYTVATCTTDSQGLCKVVFRPGVHFAWIDGLGSDRVAVTFVATAPYDANTSASKPITVTPASPLHPTRANLTCMNASSSPLNTLAHCTLVVRDTDPLRPGPAADTFDRSPPAGLVNLMGVKSGTFSNPSGCALTSQTIGTGGTQAQLKLAAPTPVPDPTTADASTCTFDYTRGTSDSDQVKATYQGEVKASAPSFLHQASSPADSSIDFDGD